MRSPEAATRKIQDPLLNLDNAKGVLCHAIQMIVKSVWSPEVRFGDKDECAKVHRGWIRIMAVVVVLASVYKLDIGV